MYVYGCIMKILIDIDDIVLAVHYIYTNILLYNNQYSDIHTHPHTHSYIHIIIISSFPTIINLFIPNKNT